MKIKLRPVLIGLILLVAVVGLTRVVPEATPSLEASASAAASWCEKANLGVSLVVDFGAESKRQAIVKCAAGFNAAGINAAASSMSNELTGWQLFKATGVEVAGTSDYPVGFACRIAGWPTPEKQPCTSTPTYAQGHWAYFYADTASSSKWVFSGAGSAMRKPVCGSADAWLFVTGDATNGTEANAVPSVIPKVFSCNP
ncbi:MAG: hypothetical protein RL196_398 [Actinomycetota bacterium]|jgi:hypothetical protein